ncbi:hypothetical protein N5079_29130 [Planotetraspora sp. A-T 1434]|uniref:hypothetical protein n=1 Tax=Planotetraspora sp. A-T 1434 TaxID=2979219 RepID=UPI0021C1F00B|nr:hypothetical protein [Planotetraspora sp. A-T 1434]MCT9934273.1 hypothetical protein [Planotetraspora sp. A-T 1434]
MPDPKLSLPETAALLVLMLEAREVSNLDLMARYGVTISGKERRNLNEKKLIESWKQGRAFTHVLTDGGWARVAEELRAGTISLPGGSAGILVRVLAAGMGNVLSRTDLSLADVFGPHEEPASAASPEPEESTASELETRIRAVYAQLAEKPGAWVSLTELRPLLDGATGTEVDQELRRMNRMPDVNIIPESNQKDLSARDRDAAVIIGDQQKHHLSIGA